MFKALLIICILCQSIRVHADSVVIEVLITAQDNQIWQPKKSMHLTLGHLKDVEGTIMQEAINCKRQYLI